MQLSGYLVETPFPGYITSTVYQDDSGVKKVEFSGYLERGTGAKDDLTMDEYLALKSNQDKAIRLVDDHELDRLFTQEVQSMITDPKVIDKARYNDMLETLPPMRWAQYGAWSMFHMSERLTGNLVSWFAKCGDQYFEFDDQADLTRAQLINKMAGL